jgi:ParB family chromosome partitioning protein
MVMSSSKYHKYRGDLRALVPAGETLAFVTVHSEGLPTAVYRLHTENHSLWTHALPAGGLSLLAAGDALWVGGSDNQIYHLPLTGGDPKPRGAKLTAPPLALAPLSGERLAVAAGTQVVVLARADGKVTQKVDLSDTVTALAADPTGQWLAAGTTKGNVAVFECESDAREFRLSDSAALHDGAVTALLFEADELRFLSSGADQKLLSTHARGKLDAEDRGRGAMHEQPITGLVAISADRFMSGSSDASLKSWPRAKGARPVTQKDGVAKVVAVAVVPVHGRPHAVAACEDNSLRFFQLDEEGKFGEATVSFFGANDWAKLELQASDARQREAALKTLAGWGDTASLERVAEQMASDRDHALRLQACQLLGEAKNPRAAKLLEKGLNHKDEAVRVAAFEGLRRHAGPKELRPLVLALKTDRADVGQLAVQALEGLAKKDDQALARLVEALDAKTADVRKSALGALEKVHPGRSPEASLTALASTHADVRRLALLRLFQRNLISDTRVQAALRWRGEDSDAEVRRVAFLLSLYTREKLVQTLRQRDPELDRQLVELESGELPALKEESKPPPGSEPAPAATTGEVPAELRQYVDQIAQQFHMAPEALLEQLKTIRGQVNPNDRQSIMSLLTSHFLKAFQRIRPTEEDESSGEEES